jgi:hypothetical protein
MLANQLQREQPGEMVVEPASTLENIAHFVGGQFQIEDSEVLWFVRIGASERAVAWRR